MSLAVSTTLVSLSAAAPSVTLSASPTAFTPSWNCSQNYLSMLLIQQDRVWLNAPYPAPGLTSSQCYPPDIMTSLATPFGSPPIQPITCPDWYTTFSQWPHGYVACCPTSYTLHLDVDGAPSDRPAAGGTCFSNMPNPTTVTAFDNVTITATQKYNDPTAQAFAYVIDGYLSVTNASQLGIPASVTPDPNSPPVFGTAAAASSPAQTHRISGGTIAGAVIATLAGLSLVIFALLLLCARARQKAYRQYSPEQVHSAMNGGFGPTIFHKVHELGGSMPEAPPEYKNVTEETVEMSASPKTPIGYRQ